MIRFAGRDAGSLDPAPVRSIRRLSALMIWAFMCALPSVALAQTAASEQGPSGMPAPSAASPLPPSGYPDIPPAGSAVSEHGPSGMSGGGANGPAAARTDEPLLQLDTGGPLASIRDIAFTRDGRQLISVGDDKVVRIWNIQQGRTTRILRGEAGDGPLGNLNALALSPDERLLAVAGWTNRGCDGSGAEDRCGDIRIYDLRDGRIKALLEGHRNVVNSLAFTPQGELLSGSDDATAILWDVGKAVARGNPLKTRFAAVDSEYVRAVRYLPQQKQVVTADSDGIIRVFAKTGGQPLRRFAANDDKKNVLKLEVSPDGKEIATGSEDGTLRLFDVADGRQRLRIDQGNYVTALAFSADGRKILAGSGGRGPWLSHVYDVDSGRELATYRGHDNTVNAVAISPDGKLAATAGGTGKEIHFWNPETGEAVGSKLRGVGSSIFAVGFIEKGKSLSLAWGRSDPCPEEHSCPNKPGTLQYRLRLPVGGQRLHKPVALGADDGEARRAVASLEGARLMHEKQQGGDSFDTLVVSTNGRASRITREDWSDGKEHLAYTLLPSGRTVISAGRNGMLQAYDLEGNPVGKPGAFSGHVGDVWSLAVSSDGRYLASGSDDQTVRLWNAETGELIVSLFHGTDDEWIVWTPQGFFHSSGKGDKMVGWQINAGAGKEARHLSAEQMAEYLQQPSVIERAIELRSAREAAEEFVQDEEFGREHRKLQDLLKMRAPEFDILSPGQDVRVDRAELDLKIDAPGVDLEQVDFQAWINDVKVETRRGLAPVGPSRRNSRTVGLPLRLYRGDNEIRVVARDRKTKLTAERLLKVTSRRGSDMKRQGALYLLAVGVNRYQHLPGRDLQAAVPDAAGFLDSLIRRTPHEQIVARLLVDNPSSHVLSGYGEKRVEMLPAQEPTAANIRAALGMFKRAKREDTTVLFIAGHGVNQPGGYLFLPGEARYGPDGKNIDRDTAVAWQTIEQSLAATRGRRILFNDSCHSGNAFNGTFNNDTADDMIIAFSAASAEAEAEEETNEAAGGRLHGIFTDAVLRAMGGQADALPADGDVHFNELHTYVTEEVKKNSKYGQVPELNSRHFRSFVFAEN